MKDETFKILMDGIGKLFDGVKKDLDREVLSKNYFQAGKYQIMLSVLSDIRRLITQYELSDLRDEK